MLRKVLQRKDNSLIFTGLTLLLVLLFRFFLQEDFLQRDFWKMFIFYLGAFFLLPWGVIRFVWREDVSEFFLRKVSWGDLKEKKKYFFWIFFWIGIFLLIMLKFDRWKDFPVSSWILGKGDLVIFLDLTLLPLVLFFQEFFYRGFLLKKFSEKVSDWWAIGGQAGVAIVFDFLFVGRDYFVSLMLFFFYCFLGWASLKNKSFLVSWWVFFLFSLMFDWIIKSKINELFLNN